MDDDDHVLQFNVNDRGQGDRQVVNAHIILLVKYRKRYASKKNHPPRVKISIYNVPPSPSTADATHTTSSGSTELADSDYQEDGVQTQTSHEPTLITSMHVVVRHTRWHDLILPTSVIQDVLDSQTGQLHFKIDCENCGNAIEPVLVRRKTKRTSSSRRRTRTGLTRKRPAKRRPWLFILTRPKSESDRVRRDVKLDQECPEHAHQYQLQHHQEDRTPCNVTSLYVRFADLGLDWVVSPAGYYANTCQGGCASRSHQSHHKQCCRVAQMSPLHLVYRDREGEVTHGHLQDMVVDRCTCQ